MSGAIGSTPNPSANRMLEAAQQGEARLATGPRATGEVKPANSVIDAGTGRIEDMIKKLNEAVLSLIAMFGQATGAAPNPNAGYRAEGNAPPPSPEQQLADYGAKKAAYDASQSYDKAVAGKEGELKAITALASLFPVLPPPFQPRPLDAASLAAIATDPYCTLEQREAAQFYLDRPAELRNLQLAAKETSGGSKAEVTAQDLGIRHSKLFAELLELKANPVAKAPDPGPMPTRPEPGAGNRPVSENAPRENAAVPAPESRTVPNPAVGSPDTVGGMPLERAVERIGRKRDSIEDQIDGLTKKLAALDPESPSFRKDSTELDRQIKSLASIESMLNNLESMLRQTIDNIIKMRHDMAMNSVRHIG